VGVVGEHLCHGGWGKTIGLQVMAALIVSTQIAGRFTTLLRPVNYQWSFDLILIKLTVNYDDKYCL